MPSPELPKTIPVRRKSRRAGTPKRVPTLPARIPARMSSEPMRRKNSKEKRSNVI